MKKTAERDSEKPDWAYLQISLSSKPRSLMNFKPTKNLFNDRFSSQASATRKASKQRISIQVSAIVRDTIHCAAGLSMNYLQVFHLRALICFSGDRIVVRSLVPRDIGFGGFRLPGNSSRV